MAGVKGKSGRKTRFAQVTEGKLESVCSRWILDNWESFDHKTKLRIALTITPKMVTQKTESTVTTKDLEDKQMELIHKAIRSDRAARVSEAN